MDAFAESFTQISRDLRRATGQPVTWKDGDPAAWLRLPVPISQHVNAFCQGVKRSRARHKICCATDNVPQCADRPGRPFRRRCPFGLVEVVVPFAVGREYQGCCFIGAWRDPRCPRPTGVPSVDRIYTSLPPWPRQQAEAAGRLTARLVSDILHLRDPSAPAGDPRIAAAVDYINTHLAADLRVQPVAAAVHLSPSRFVHLFKETTGRSFTDFLQERLMRRAAVLLTRGDRDVTRTALALGYHNPAYFSTAFKRFHGASPSAWRNRIRTAGE